MSTTTYHISFPAEWAKEIEKEMEKEHYSVSEYFKQLYRIAKQQKNEHQDFQKFLLSYEKEKKSGTLKKLESANELFE